MLLLIVVTMVVISLMLRLKVVGRQVQLLALSLYLQQGRAAHGMVLQFQQPMVLLLQVLSQRLHKLLAALKPLVVV